MPTLYYIHDPMCSWCWAFRPALLALKQSLPKTILFEPLLGGLAPDSDQPMPEEMQQQLQSTWRRIQEKLPETRFNYDFWRLNQPRRSTYPACRAVIAARQISLNLQDDMTLAIQQAYYLKALNPSDNDVLINLAEELGIDSTAFAGLLHSDRTQNRLEEEIEQSRLMGARSFPSLILKVGEGYWPVPVDYRSPTPILETIEMLLD